MRDCEAGLLPLPLEDREDEVLRVLLPDSERVMDPERLMVTARELVRVADGDDVFEADRIPSEGVPVVVIEADRRAGEVVALVLRDLVVVAVLEREGGRLGVIDGQPGVEVGRIKPVSSEWYPEPREVRVKLMEKVILGKGATSGLPSTSSFA